MTLEPGEDGYRVADYPALRGSAGANGGGGNIRYCKGLVLAGMASFDYNVRITPSET